MAGTHEGTVWWITGLSGAGKSTVGRLVRDGLRARGRPALLLDGDVMRAVLDETAALSPDDRRRLGMTYGRLAREVASQGIDVVCATISMFGEVRAWNRHHIPSYFEIYLRVPLAELERRDTRGIYAAARRAADAALIGFVAPFDEPDAADLVIDNIGSVDPEIAAARILALQAR